MPEFKEELLQFIWKNRLLKPLPLKTVSGKSLSLINQGEWNRNSGPDFFNGQIQVNELILAGNIEIHLKSSDWLKHKHQNDSSYDRIILHVVYEHDKEIPQNNFYGVEVLELKEYISQQTIWQYEELSKSSLKIPCQQQLKAVDDIKYLSWLERMAVERLEHKTERVKKLFEEFRGDYTQTFYFLFVRNLGFNTNSLPFELLARQLPIHLLLKHADDLFQLESLLFGFSGLLDEQFEDAYMRALQNDFEFKIRKYHLVPLKKEIFKFSKMRPSNFPTFRLAQLASIIHQHPALFSAPHHFTNFEELIKLFQIAPSLYWQNRFVPDGKQHSVSHHPGRESAENIVVNTMAPFFFFYAQKLNKPQFHEAAIILLNKCAAENNLKTRLFNDKKSMHVNAASSQGLINLYDHYCSHKKCLNCGVAAALLKAG